jgi:hypothetical protein
MVVDGMPILEGQNSWGWNQEEEQQVWDDEQTQIHYETPSE